MPKVHTYAKAAAEHSWGRELITSWTTEIMMATEDNKANIHYECGDNDVSSRSPICDGSIVVGGKDLDQNSKVVLVKYMAGYEDGSCRPPVKHMFGMFSRPVPMGVMPKSGVYFGEQDILMDTSEGSIVYYTLDGSCPLDDSGSPTHKAIKYTCPIDMPEGKLTAVAVSSDGKTFSELLTNTYAVKEASLEMAASHDSGFYSEPIAVRLEGIEDIEGVEGEDAFISYTLDGSKPKWMSGTLYQEAIILGNCEDEVCLRAIAMNDTHTSKELIRNYKFKE